MRRKTTLIVAVLVAGHAYAQQIYKCREPSGTISYQEHPCTGRQHEEVFTGGQGYAEIDSGAATANASGFIAQQEAEEDRMRARRYQAERQDRIDQQYDQAAQNTRSLDDAYRGCRLRSSPRAGVASNPACDRLEIESRTSRVTGQRMPDETHLTIINNDSQRHCFQRDGEVVCD